MKNHHPIFSFKSYSLHLLFCLLLSIPAAVQAQVYNGDITLTNQEQVNAFNYTTVNGNLKINGTGLGQQITNLNGLSELTIVTGNLEIGDRNPDIAGVHIFPNLQGLNSLSSIGGKLGIFHNFWLENLNGLESLTSVGEIEIWRNYLTDISALSGLTSPVNDLIINLNFYLTSLDGLEGIPSVTGNLQIEANYELTDIDGLSGISSVSQNLIIHSNFLITNLDSLRNITSIGGNVEIRDNNQLTNIDGLLGASSSIGGNVEIRDNNQLTNIDGLSGHTSGGLIRVQRNNLLANINGLANLTSAAGISIYANDNLTNLDGLSSLQSLTGGFPIPPFGTTKNSLILSGNAALTNVNGLSSLTSIPNGAYYVEIRDNPVLTEYCGLYPLFSGYPATLLRASGNGVHPTVAGVIAGGPCIPDPVVLISELLTNSAITSGNADALLVKLNDCNLIPFNNQVNAFVNAGAITQVEADDLIAGAAALCAGSRFAASDATFDLGQSYPNPTANYALIPFTLSTAGQVSLKLYNATGQVVRTLLAEPMEIGTHDVKVNLSELPTGTYFYRLEAGGDAQTLPLIKQ